MDAGDKASMTITDAGEAPVQKRGGMLAVIALGAILVIAGQVLLAQTPLGHPSLGSRLGVAGVLLILGALCFGWATPRILNPPLVGSSSVPTDEPDSASARRWSFVVLSVFLAITAADLFVLFGESAAVRLLWLASILVLWVDPLFRRPAFGARPKRVEAPYLVGLLALLVVAFISRTYHLTTLPYDVDQDFAAEGLQARALATGQEPNIFKFGDRQAPMFTYLPAALTMKLFGTGLAGLNASGVVEGLLIILGAFLLARELFNSRVGLFAAAFLVVSLAHLSASRQSGYIDPVFYLTFASYFMICGLRRKSDAAVVAGGVMTALSMESYWSGRLILPLFALALFILILFRRQWLSARRGQILLGLIALLVTLGPMLVVLARQPLVDIAHPQAVSIFSPDIMQHQQQQYKVDSAGQVLVEQARRALLAIHYFPDTGTQFALGRPLLDGISAFFFTLGLGCASAQV